MRAATRPSTSLLTGIAEKDYAAVWCNLNRLERDERVQNWPANWSEMNHHAQHEFVWPVMSEIMEAIGIKECLREWNKEMMPGEAFDEWYGRGGRRL